jgi:hypothetical protein
MEEEEEYYEITPEGMLTALKAEAYMHQGLTVEETAEKLDMPKEALQVLMVLMPNDMTIASLGFTPEQVLEA